MKILYHHRTQGRGVEGVHIRGIANALKGMGHDVVMLSPPGVDPYSCDDTEKKDSTKGSPLACFWKWLGKNMPEIGFELTELAYNLWAYLKLRDAVRKEKFDFIYERYALNTFAGLIISKRYDIPLVLEVNDSARIERVRKLTMTGLANSLEDKVFKGAAAIFTISSYFKKIIDRIEGIDDGKVFVTPNAVDGQTFNSEGKNHFAVRDKYSLGDSIVIGYTGAFVYWHRVDLLLESFRDLVKENKNLKLFLVGDGVTFDPSKKFARENKIGDLIVMPGRVRHEEVPSYIEAMDICVIPDSNLYGSPVKLFEYMAMGKPVVAPSVMPLEDVIRDGENGILFEKANARELRSALNGLIKDAGLRKKIGEKAKAAVFEKHTWERNARAVIDVVKARKVKRKGNE